jgi:hypothetical protein
VNVYAAPSSIPGPLDMFLPFGIALLEFMLFTILTTPLINQLDPRTIVVVWFSCFAAFGAVTTTVLARVRWLFEHTDYGSKSLQNAVSNMSKKMAADQAASSITGLISVAAAVALSSTSGFPATIAYLSAWALAVAAVMAIFNQRREAGILDQALGGATPSRSPNKLG